MSTSSGYTSRHCPWPCLWIGILLVFGWLLWPGRHGWALDDAAARATLKGLAGVEVKVGDLAPEIETSGVSRAHVETQVKQQFHRAGIPVLAEPDAGPRTDAAYFTVSISTLHHETGLYAYAVDLAVYQEATLTRLGTVLPLPTWSMGSIGVVAATEPRAILTTVRANVEQFLHAYREVNPRPRPPAAAAAASVQRVRQAQARLQAAGFAPGPRDGQLGPQTRRAIRQYQRRKGFPETGLLDTRTLKALGVR